MFKNLKIRTRLSLGLFVIIFCFSAIACISSLNMGLIEETINELRRDFMPGVIDMCEMENEIYEIKSRALSYILKGNAVSQGRSTKELLNEVMDSLEKITAEHAEFASAISLEEKKEAQELENKIKQFIFVTKEIINLKDNGAEVDELADKMEEYYRPIFFSLIEQFDNHKAVHARKLADAEERVSHISAYANTLILSLILATLFLALLTGYVVSNSILKPIRKLRAGVEIVQGGDLNYKVSIASKDEIGVLSRSFDAMTAAVKKSRAEIDKKVKEQTKEILTKQKLLGNQQKATLNVLEDVEEEKEKTSREKNKIDAILHSIGDGVFVVDKNLKIIMFNEIAAQISGYSIKEATDRKYYNILKFVYEKDGKINDKFIKGAIATGEIKEMSNHTMLIKKDGRKVAVADSAAPLKNKHGDVIGCVVVFRDVTKEREIDRMKTEFVSVASHQLRTPLTGIKWFTELLIKGKAGKLNKKQADFLQQVSASNERMIALVNDLLSVSRIETGRKFTIEKKKVDIVEIITQVLSDNISLARDKKVKIIKCKSRVKQFKIVVDGDKIRQVFHNLISNAIKYSKEKGKVKINCDHGKKDEVVFSIEDNGAGIPKDQQKRIFEKFFRADNIAVRGIEGTGLGLYIAKAIVEAHGGKMWFKSAENKGSVFYFSLPM